MNSAKRSPSTINHCRRIISTAHRCSCTSRACWWIAIKSAEALAKSEESIKIWTATSPASSPQTALAHAIHAYALEHLGKLPQAAEELNAAVPVLVKARGSEDAAVRRALGWQKIADPNALQAASANVTVHRP